MSEPRRVQDDNGIRYELGELLGRGGQGAVYAVRNHPLAVKLLAGRNQLDRDRLRRQLTFVKRLDLEKLPLAKPLAILAPPRVGYLMNLLTGMVPIQVLLTPPKGEPAGIEWYLRTGGLRRRLRVLARAAHTLSQLHGKGLAYSDPSPANIFISEDPDFAEVWFIDTDNLRVESSTGSGVYTPGYGAPELVQGKSGVTTLTDAHAFAVIAFQALVLAHPFIGDLVNEGEPELEEQALEGLIPWIDDANDDCNHASFGIPRKWVLSPRLSEAFERTFGAGRVTPTARPGAAQWAELLLGAADSTIPCPKCQGTFFFNQPCCPWCDAERPTFATALFHLWDPALSEADKISKKPKNGERRPYIVSHGTVTSTSPFIVTRRQAFDSHESDADDGVIEVSLAGNHLSLRSLDGKSYTFLSASGDRKTEVSDRQQTVRLVPGQSSWRLHFGEMGRRHRTLSFELRPGSDS